ncbi:MAG: hypothetical protein M3R36_16270 [Bacteroidota bacterium]|nr:hypothetical protein [Bacteroidota bacterium]
MEILANIKEIKYTSYFSEDLKIVNIKRLNINNCQSSCLVTHDNNIYAISKWVSPKRTRSYPYERVYNTLNNFKKITVIPIVKDEGLDGDRDYLQFDTISLMSLLNVYIIYGYYNSAERNFKYVNKITNQKFSNRYIKSKLRELNNYHSSALHWNINELLKINILLKKANLAFKKVESKLKIKFHSKLGLENFKKTLLSDIDIFRQHSRLKSQQAQHREFRTTQPKEFLSSVSKCKITVQNYLGGMYYLTMDENVVINRNLKIIESKFSNSSKLPSKSDIRDGLLKMVLFSNLDNVKIDNKKYIVTPILKLVSTKIKNSATNKSSDSEIINFIEQNKFKENEKVQINILFKEANENNFIIQISGTI